MVFWTIVFFTIALISLIRGTTFYDTFIKQGELTVKAAEEENAFKKKQIEGEILKAIWPVVLYAIVSLIAELIYLMKAINIDTLKYPTVAFIVWAILVFAKGTKPQKKNNLQTEEGRKEYLKQLYSRRRWNFFGVVNSIINLGFYGYMFYILVFRG